MEGKMRRSETEHYQPLLTTPGTDSSVPAAFAVTIPANMQPGDTISTCFARQSSSQDFSASTAEGIPVSSSVAAGQLVFLPDLPLTSQLWHSQRLIMILWLISSLLSLVLFAPLFMASGAFLAGEIAAVMGIIAAVVQLCERQLVSNNTLELGAQIRMAATCGSAACLLDTFALVVNLLLVWKLACDPSDDICTTLSKYTFLYALSCVHHGAVSYLVASRASGIMSLLNPVSSGAVQL